MVESFGDYREEAWLEDHVGGPLYEQQATLPRLPVPTIPQTMDRLVPTVAPLAETPQELAAFQAAVAKFPSQAQTLQERLLHRYDANPDSSWLQHWWNTAGYLQVRDSVVINVSYYFGFSDTTQSQYDRASSLLQASMDYRNLIVSGQRAPDPNLCSVAYKYMFHACRVPRPDHDSYRLYDPAVYSHAVVARHGYWFVVSTPTPDWQQLEDMAVEMQQMGLPQLGWCTATDRDTWAQTRQHWIQHIPAMEQALETLESASVALCLDDTTSIPSRNDLAHRYLHGGASGGNRWFDKSIQFIVTSEGQAGLLGEHSMMDGMPVTTLADYVTKHTSVPQGSPSAVQPVFSVELLQQVQKLSEDRIANAREAHLDWTGRHSIHTQRFHGYGRNWIKQAGFSPDAYVQMAMQIATARLFGKQVGTYEATQVRPFRHGRTETTRTVSPESHALIDKMNHGKATVDDLKAAVKVHSQYLKQAAQGMGVDRHLFGLSMLVDKEATPDLYHDPVFQRAKRWRVSTSNLSHPKIENWGYGEVVPDGVGLSYSVHPRHLVFAVTALQETGWSPRLVDLLEGALLDLRMLVEKEGGSLPSSKL